MKRSFMLIFLLSGTLKSYSEDKGVMNYRGLKLKIDSHTTTLASSEKLTPIYTELKYNFKDGEKLNPFLKGSFGFSYVENMEDTNSVLEIDENRYYSIGTGIDINNLSIELDYVIYQVGYMNENDVIDEDRIVFKIKYSY